MTRRYEFYKYAAAADTIDGENGEAMCDEVDPTTNPNNPQYLHGVGNSVAVTDANGDTYYVDCAAQVVVGEYIGAQMAGFDAAMPLGLVDHLQDGEKDVDYPPRSVVVGGNTPYTIIVPAGRPAARPVAGGLTASCPALRRVAGTFNFTVQATDADNAVVSNTYVLTVAGDVVVPQYALAVEKFGGGTGTVAGNGIDCGATCDVTARRGHHSHVDGDAGRRQHSSPAGAAPVQAPAIASSR